jgi:hypothetical protein
MRKPTLSNREKNMGVMVLGLSLFIIGWGIRSRWDRKVEQGKESLLGLEERLNQSKKLLTMGNEPEAPLLSSTAVPADSNSSLFLLRDLTDSDVAKKVRIISAERGLNGVYRLEVEGEFQELMRFMGFLERQEGKFVLQTVNIHRSERIEGGPAGQTPNPEVAIRPAGTPSRKVLAIFQLSMKG